MSRASVCPPGLEGRGRAALEVRDGRLGHIRSRQAGGRGVQGQGVLSVWCLVGGEGRCSEVVMETTC